MRGWLLLIPIFTGMALVACSGGDTWVDAVLVTTEKGVVHMPGEGPLYGYVYTLYPNGDTETVRHYTAGLLEGESCGWYEKGQPKFVYHYRNDVYDGNVKEWLPTGQLYRNYNYEDGQEQGLQTMYWDDGRIRANYEIKNGRKYGLTGIKHCTTPNNDSFKQLLTSGM